MQDAKQETSERASRYTGDSPLASKLNLGIVHGGVQGASISIPTGYPDGCQAESATQALKRRIGGLEHYKATVLANCFFIGLDGIFFGDPAGPHDFGRDRAKLIGNLPGAKGIGDVLDALNAAYAPVHAALGAAHNKAVAELIADATKVLGDLRV